MWSTPHSMHTKAKTPIKTILYWHCIKLCIYPRCGAMQNQECWLAKNPPKSEFFQRQSCLVTGIQKWIIQNERPFYTSLTAQLSSFLFVNWRIRLEWWTHKFSVTNEERATSRRNWAVGEIRSFTMFHLKKNPMKAERDKKCGSSEWGIFVLSGKL